MVAAFTSNFNKAISGCCPRIAIPLENHIKTKREKLPPPPPPRDGGSPCGCSAIYCLNVVHPKKQVISQVGMGNQYSNLTKQFPMDFLSFLSNTYAYTHFTIIDVSMAQNGREKERTLSFFF